MAGEHHGLLNVDVGLAERSGIRTPAAVEVHGQGVVRLCEKLNPPQRPLRRRLVLPLPVDRPLHTKSPFELPAKAAGVP